MKHFTTLVLTAVAILIAVTGCAKMDINDGGLAPGRGSSRNLGDTSYQQAFASGRMIMAQYYSIDSANVNTGIIKGKPKLTKAGRERILGNSPSRQIATMEITQEGGTVLAQVLVMQQRQGASAMQRMGYSTAGRNYNGRPGDETPADLNAASTAKQKEAWENEKPLHSVEGKILEDLFKALHH